MLFSFPPVIMCCWYKNRKMTQQLKQERELSPQIVSMDDTDNVQPLEYEEVGELRPTASSNPSNNSLLRELNTATDCSLTQCPAYGQVPQDSTAEAAVDSLSPLTPTHDGATNPRAHQYEDVEKVQTTSSRSATPTTGWPQLSGDSIAMEYVFTQCPAYATSEQVSQV